MTILYLETSQRKIGLGSVQRKAQRMHSPLSARAAHFIHYGKILGKPVALADLASQFER